MNAQFEELVESYITGNVGVSENFLTGRLTGFLRQHVKDLSEEGLMVRAGTGNGTAPEVNQQLRGDKISWLDRKHRNVHEQEFLDHIEAFIGYLNRTCYTGINAYEFHYALYEQGSFYSKHKDQFKTDNKRKFSFISYLNDNWMQEDGGQLWMHREGEDVQQIIPTGRKAVFFKSDEMEHEVTVANRPRMSITGWLKVV